MSIYYQHIGEALWNRDAPKSIGTFADGVRRFSFDDIRDFLDEMHPIEQKQLEITVTDLAPTGFQIWGIPSGAKKTLKDMSQGDFLLLLESTDFRYAGQVIFHITQPLYRLSKHIWDEERFPIIVLLQGEMISYSWEKFRENFHFDERYHMRGNTMRLKEERFKSSQFITEEKFIAEILTTAGYRYGDQEKDFNAFANNLTVHMQMVKIRHQQQIFRRRVLELQGEKCAVCDLEVSGVIEAAHIIPKRDNGTDDARNGLALCATHHRMFDVGLFHVNPNDLSIYLCSDGYSRADLRITRTNLNHLRHPPHSSALEWRWQNFTRTE